MNYRDWTLKDLQIISEELDSVVISISEIDRIVQESEIPVEASGVMFDQVEDLVSKSTELRSRVEILVQEIHQAAAEGPELDGLQAKTQQEALLLVATISSLNDEVVAFEAAVLLWPEDRSMGPALSSKEARASVKRTSSRVSKWVKTKVIPILKKVMGKAWSILANLLTPTGWSVSGELGTGILGLAKVELEIKFGK